MTRQNSSSGASVTAPILRRGAACVVVKDRQFSKPLNGFREGCFDTRFFADVALNEMSIAAGILGPRAGRLSCSLATPRVDLGDDDLRAFLGKAFGGGTANAAAATRNECNFARETRHEFYPQP